MGDDEPKDESTDGSEHQADEQATDSDQSAGQAEQQPVESGRPAEQSEEQAFESDQTSMSLSGTDTVAFAEGAASPDEGGAGSTAEPAKGGSGITAPRKRLFRFHVHIDDRGLPDPIRNRVDSVGALTLMGYPFAFVVQGKADSKAAHAYEDGWTVVPDDGLMDVPLMTIEKSSFLVGVSVIPNSKVDPKAPTSRPLERIASISTDEFASRRDFLPALVKMFPDGIFSLDIQLAPSYVQIVDAGLMTFEAQLADRKIRLEDIVYDDVSTFTDPRGDIGRKHDVIYWETDPLHVSGVKYTP